MSQNWFNDDPKFCTCFIVSESGEECSHSGDLEDIFNVIENHWDEIRYVQIQKEVEVNNRHFYYGS
jgi:hypothetical protein